MPSSDKRPLYVVTGRIIKPYGVLGWVKVEKLTANPQRFCEGHSFMVEGSEDKGRLVLEAVREVRGNLVVKFQGLESREEVARLAGNLLLVAPEELGDSPEDSLWEHQVLGLEVRTEQGRSLGEVREVMETGANDVLLVQGEKEYLIPMIGDVVVGVDLDAGMIIVRPLPGLLED